MKMRAVIVTESGSTYIWSPAWEMFWHVDNCHMLRDVIVDGVPTVGARCVVRGEMLARDGRGWVPGSKLTTSTVVSVVWEPDMSCLAGTKGPVRTFVPTMEVV